MDKNQHKNFQFSTKESGSIKYDNSLVDGHFIWFRDESISLGFKALLEHCDKDEEMIGKVNEFERQQEEKQNNRFKPLRL